jgi:hypothetical protein
VTSKNLLHYYLSSQARQMDQASSWPRKHLKHLVNAQIYFGYHLKFGFHTAEPFLGNIRNSHQMP